MCFFQIFTSYHNKKTRKNYSNVLILCLRVVKHSMYAINQHFIKIVFIEQNFEDILRMHLHLAYYIILRLCILHNFTFNTQFLTNSSLYVFLVAAIASPVSDIHVHVQTKSQISVQLQLVCITMIILIKTDTF